MIDHRSYTGSCEIKAWEKFRPERNIWTNDLCGTSAVLYQLSYQAISELVTLWNCNIPVEGDFANEYTKEHIFKLIDHRSYTHNFNSFEIKAWKKKMPFRPEFFLRL